MSQENVRLGKWTTSCRMGLVLCSCVVLMGADCMPRDAACQNLMDGEECVPPAGSPDAPKCQAYICAVGECTSIADPTQSGDSCSDETGCTEEGTCQSGDCVADFKPAEWSCPDGDNTECTRSECDGSGMCLPVVLPRGTPCADAEKDDNDCTDDVCQGGECHHPKVDNGTDCEKDGNSCTTEICLEGECTSQGCDPRTGEECTTAEGEDGTCQTIVGVPPCQCIAPPEKVVVLYIASANGNSVISYQDPSTVNGNIAPDTDLFGAQTQLFFPTDIVVTANDTLIVSNFDTNTVTSYANARESNGNLSPDGNVQGVATMLDRPVTLAVNTAEDLLFVANGGAADEILVYSGASNSSLNGNLAPTRTITSTDIRDPVGMNFGANDDLYVVNASLDNIVVIAGASEVNGNVAATRTIGSGAFGDLSDVFIDADDTMYVVDRDGFIYTFNNASTLNGSVDPDFVLTVPPAVALTAIAVDADGNAYIVDNGADAVYSYDSIATLNGALNPDRTIQGDQTQMDGPFRVFLDE